MESNNVWSDGNGTWNLGAMITDSGWTLITGTVDLQWTGELQAGLFLIRQISDGTIYHVDDCILTKK